MDHLWSFTANIDFWLTLYVAAVLRRHVTRTGVARAESLGRLSTRRMPPHYMSMASATSTEPPATRIGHPLARPTAASRSVAVTRL